MVQRFVVGLMALVTLTSCVTISQKPEVFKVKTVAVISVYVNTVVKDVESSKMESPSITLLQLVTNDPDRDRFQLLAESAQKSAEEALAKVSRWTVVPSGQWADKPPYLAMKADAESARTRGQSPETGLGLSNREDLNHLVAAPNLALVPLSAIPTGGISITIGANGKTVTQDDVKHYWAKLAADLGVDAVAVVAIDLAYKKNVFSGIRIPLVLTSADASVDAGIVAITKDGTLVLNSQGFTGQRQAGEAAPMLMGGEVFTLGDDKKEAIHAFDQAMDLKLQQIAQTLIQELQATN